MNTTQTNELAFAIIVCSILFLLLVVLFFLVAYYYQKRKLQHIKDILFLKNNFNQEILKSQLEIQEQTLKTISQEIHDNIGQQLSVAKFTLNTIPLTVDDALNKQIENTGNIIGAAIQDLRDLSKTINNDAIEKSGLINAVKHQLELLSKIGIDTCLEETGISQKINPQKALILFRIIQESLNNVIKHAKATEIKIMLHYHTNELEILIMDNGIGFDTSMLNLDNKGIGLINIKNRSGVINAELNIESVISHGTQVKIIVNTPYI